MDRERHRGRGDLGVDGRGRNVRDRLPTIAFLAALVVALIVFEWYGRRFWFVGDEWNFLVRNRLVADDPGAFVRTLLRPHNEHWSVLPRLWYWLADSIWGLRTYTPYLTAIILLHLGVATLLWRLILRLGVHPWIAAGTGAVMALLGPGAENIFWGFQVGFVGSAFFGLAALLLADHDGSDRRRDGLALLCGLASLLCSGIGIPFVVGLGIAIWFRRGLRPAVAIVLPLAVMFAMWYVAFGRANEANTVPRAGPSQWLPYIFVQGTNAIEQISQIPMVGGGVIAILIVFVGVRIRHDFRAHEFLAPMYGLLGSALVMSITTAIGRSSLGADQARSSRYVYLLAVMLIPVLAVMLDALLRRDRRAIIPVAVFLAIAVVGCFTAIPRFAFAQGQQVAQQKLLILAAASDPLMQRFAPEGSIPAPALSPDVSVAALRERWIEGDLPQWTADDVSRDAVRLSALIGLNPATSFGPIDPARITGKGFEQTTVTGGCVRLSATEPHVEARVAVTPDSGVVISTASGDIEIASLTFAADRRHPVPVVVPGGQSTAVSVAAPAELAMVLARIGAAVTICGES